MIPAILRRRRYSLAVAVGDPRCSACSSAGWSACRCCAASRSAASGTLVGQPAPRSRRPTSTAATGHWPMRAAGSRGSTSGPPSCDPCRTEMPAMQRHRRGVRRRAARPRRRLGRGPRRGRGLRRSVRRDVPDPARSRPRDLLRWAGTDGLPRHYFIGAAGHGAARGHRSAGPGSDGRDRRGAPRS